MRCRCDQQGCKRCSHPPPSQMSLDRLELSVDGGRVKIFVQIGHYDKTLIIGQVILMVVMIIIIAVIISYYSKTLG